MKILEYDPEGKTNFCGDKEPFFAQLFTAPEGYTLKLHSHPNQEEMYIVLEGEAEVEVSGQTIRLNPGRMIVFEKDEPHKITALTKLCYLIIKYPNIVGGEKKIVE